MALPPPTRSQLERSGLTRFAAAQPINEPPSSVMMRSKMVRKGAGDPQFRVGYIDWQQWARRYAREIDIAQFAAGAVADTAGRVEIIPEQLNKRGDWKPLEDDTIRGVLTDYANDLQDRSELVRLHAWHYQVAGECMQVMRDDREMVEWGIYSREACSYDKNDDTVLVRETPNGNLREGTAFKVPAEQVIRFWVPDEEWRGYPTSPMVGTIQALHRYHALNRYSTNVADSAFAMAGGLLWTPEEAHRRYEQPAGDGDGGGGQSAAPKTSMANEWAEIAEMRLRDGQSLAAVMPPEVHWKHEYGPPQWVEIGRGLDDQSLSHLEDALKGFARGHNLPSSWVLSGGPGEGNHWSDWLTEERFQAAIAPIVDRIMHLNMTRSFLNPWFKENGRDRDIGRIRVGYDPTNVIVRPDQSAAARELAALGILSFDAVLRANNFDTDDRMTEEERAILIEVLSKKAGGAINVNTGGPPAASPATVTKAPPAVPQAAALTPVNVYVSNGNGTATSANVSSNGHRMPRTAAPVIAANALLEHISTIRRDVFRQLRAQAELAFKAAIAQAAVKVQVKARNAKNRPAAVRDAAIAAVAAGRPLRAHIAALGLHEQEILRSSLFDTYRTEAVTELRRARERERAEVTAAGYDPDELLGHDGVDDAATFLATALFALALVRLNDGHPLEPARGEVSGTVPASLTRQALGIAEGHSQMIPSTDPSVLPDVIEVRGAPDLVDQLTQSIASDETIDGEPAVVYRWNWGFYGDPNIPFEPHQDLGVSDFETTEITDDPALAVDDRGSWLGVDFYQPGDHDGCTCEWVPVIEARYAHEPATSQNLPGEIPGLGGSPQAVQDALDAVGAV